MQGHIRKRGKGGSYEYIIDIGEAQAQRCRGCRRRFWVEHQPLASCPRCGGGLRLTEERRRQTKAGFASRKEAQAALNKVLAAVAERSYVAPSKETLEQFLTGQWLPAIEATVRLTTYRSYVQHVRWHIVPHLGAMPLQSLSGAQINALYARLASCGRQRWQELASRPHHPPRARRPAPRPERRRALGRDCPQPDRGGRPAAGLRLSRDEDLERRAARGLP